MYNWHSIHCTILSLYHFPILSHAFSMHAFTVYTHCNTLSILCTTIKDTQLNISIMTCLLCSLNNQQSNSTLQLSNEYSIGKSLLTETKSNHASPCTKWMAKKTCSIRGVRVSEKKTRGIKRKHPYSAFIWPNNSRGGGGGGIRLSDG